MSEKRFDQLTVALATEADRRRFLIGMGGLAAAVAAFLGVAGTGAAVAAAADDTVIVDRRRCRRRCLRRCRRRNGDDCRERCCRGDDDRDD